MSGQLTYVSKEDALRLQLESLFTMSFIEKIFKTQELEGAHLSLVFPHDHNHQLTRLKTFDNISSNGVRTLNNVQTAYDL